jgi:hypothetical protein
VKKENKEYRRVIDVYFQEVEGHKHNFASFSSSDGS